MTENRWSVEKIRKWYDNQPWPCGFNYIPANAIGYTEMWMDYCFDPVFIEKELLLAKEIGFNCIRVVLPFIVWENEPEAFKQRFDAFLEICDKCGLKVMPSLFDDCCFGDQINPVFGKQPDVIPGWYGNGWTPSPGHGIVRDSSQWGRLEPYVKDIVGSFKNDSRVWIWDLYNEPTNGLTIGKISLPLGNVTLPLLEKVVKWAREINPSQPLTIGSWDNNDALNEIAWNCSDIITFHNYANGERVKENINQLKAFDRPIICTEWLNRGLISSVGEILSVFKDENVGAMHWGLVNGKTQTHLCWCHLPGQPDPPVWQHDLYYSDHTPYDINEINLFKSLGYL